MVSDDRIGLTDVLMLQCCVCRRLSVTLCTVAKVRCFLPKNCLKWPMGNWMVTWPMTLPWPQKVKFVTPIRSRLNISKTAGDAI